MINKQEGLRIDGSGETKSIGDLQLQRWWRSGCICELSAFSILTKRLVMHAGRGGCYKVGRHVCSEPFCHLRLLLMMMMALIGIF
jgi:hypothetical protein